MSTLAAGKSKEEQFREKLAILLGISFEELEEYGEEVEENNGNHGQRKYAYSLQFSDDTPEELAGRISRLSRHNIVYFNLEELQA